MINEAIVRDARNNRWLQFSDPVQVVTARVQPEVLPALDAANDAVERHGLHAAGFIAYEAAPAFDPAFCVQPPVKNLPLLWFGLYPKAAAIEPPPPSAGFSVGRWQPTTDRAEFGRALQQIKTYIAAGETYQVNYTLRLQTKFSGDARALFWRLARAQSSGYAALISTGRHIVCSASPELFFARNGLHVEMRPMKGTAPRGCTTAEDAANIRWLEESLKNRAENVMIVDMIRNDLSVTADPGTVRVPRLFTVEKYPTVLQMTTTVTAQTGASTSTLFSALFPCASITGAPKVRTMQIISELETSPRGVYTGCVGFMSPGRQAQFNVAIRTVCIDQTTGTAEYGVGSGIVWDSDTAEEYEECQTKAQVLAADRPDFDLLETLLWEPGSGYFLPAAHVSRMVDSARYFDVPVAETQLWHKLEQAARNLGEQPCRVRLLASRTGNISVQATPLAQSALPRRFSVALAPSPVDSKNPFLYHKTTHRQVYRRAQAAHPAADDVLLWNERGEITESCIANVVVRFGNRLVTPPVECGLLAGTYRAHLLAQRKITEQVVTLDDLKRADRVYLINSVRRWIDVLPLFDTQEMPFASF